MPSAIQLSTSPARQSSSSRVSNECAEAGAGHKERTLRVQNVGIEGRHGSARLAEQRHGAARAENIEALQKSGGADGIVDDIHALSVGESFTSPGKILARIDDHFIRAGLFRDGGFSSVPAVP